MLQQSHTKTSPPSVYFMQTAPKLLYLAKGLTYGWYHHDDVIRDLARWFCQNLAGVKEFQICKFESQRLLCRGSGAFSFLYTSKKLLEP